MVGFDHQISFMKLLKACSYLRDPDCIFLGTNEDSFLPMDPGERIFIPGEPWNESLVGSNCSSLPPILI